MEKIIKIGNQDVKLASTAGTLYRYRTQFKRDLTKDIVNLKKTFTKIKANPEEQFSLLDLELFEHIAWAMAKTAEPNLPPIENWLDEFETFSIYEVLPEILEMLSANFGTTSQDQKKAIAPVAVQQAQH